MGSQTVRMLAVCATAALLGAGVTGCDRVVGDGARRTDKQSFAFTGDALVIDGGDYDLRVVVGSAGTVQAERTLRGKATKDGNASWSLAGNTLTLRVRCNGIVVNCGGLHIVAVPPGIAVDVRNDAVVRAVGLTGPLTVAVSDAWLRVEDPAGPLRLTSRGANVEVTGARSTDVMVSASDANATLSFAAAPRRVTVKTSAGSVRVNLPRGPETYQLTGNGGHGLTSDPNSTRVIQASATDGDVAIRKAT